jgi:hypothetical protein
VRDCLLTLAPRPQKPARIAWRLPVAGNQGRNLRIARLLEVTLIRQISLTAGYCLTEDRPQKSRRRWWRDGQQQQAALHIRQLVLIAASLFGCSPFCLFSHRSQCEGCFCCFKYRRPCVPRCTNNCLGFIYQTIVLQRWWRARFTFTPGTASPARLAVKGAE